MPNKKSTEKLQPHVQYNVQHIHQQTISLSSRKQPGMNCAIIIIANSTHEYWTTCCVWVCLCKAFSHATLSLQDWIHVQSCGTCNIFLNKICIRNSEYLSNFNLKCVDNLQEKKRSRRKPLSSILIDFCLSSRGQLRDVSLFCKLINAKNEQLKSCNVDHDDATGWHWFNIVCWIFQVT